MVLRMKDDGATFLAVVEALEQRGLDRDDIQLLFEGSPQLDAWRAGQQVRAREPASEQVGASRPAPRVAPRVRVEVPAGLTTQQSPQGPNTLRWVGFAVAAVIAGFGFFISPMGIVNVSMGVVALAVAVAVWSGTRREAMPGVPDFIDGGLFESSDVQFAVAVPGGATVGLGESFDVLVTAQSCVDAARVLVVELGGQTAHVSSPLRHEFELPPGVVVEVLVPFRVSSLSSSALSFEVAVFGLGDAQGARLRSSRGATFITPKHSLATNLIGVATLAVVGAGFFVLGANGSFRIRVDGDRPISHAEPSARTRVLFAPTKSATPM